MGIFDFLSGLGKSAGKADRLRHKERWGKKGAFRKVRNGDLVGRGKNGRFKK